MRGVASSEGPEKPFTFTHELVRQLLTAIGGETEFSSDKAARSPGRLLTWLAGAHDGSVEARRPTPARRANRRSGKLTPGSAHLV
jgi:hypothetical protein